MSNTKIVIDKDVFQGMKNVLDKLHDVKLTIPYTEIQIDQSIEEKIKSILNKYEPINKGTEYFYNSNSVIESMQEIATSQQIIEQLRVKEKVSELNKCFEKGNQECDGAYCQGCWKDIVRSVIKSLTK